jgi:hypothetical protein
VRPESGARSVDAGAFAGFADVLARKPARNDVNTASPRPSVKSLYIIPDRKRVERPVVLPSHEHAGGVGVALDSAHAAPSKQLAAKDAAARAGEQGELAQLSRNAFDSNHVTTGLLSYRQNSTTLHLCNDGTCASLDKCY